MTYKGKAIYNPSGKAGEYSYWACNFFVGCSNGCTYCYLKKGIPAKVLGGDTPQLKKCFKDQIHALGVFTKEVNENEAELQKHGLFFTFTSDPMLHETKWLTKSAVEICNHHRIPVKILTKRADLMYFLGLWNSDLDLSLIAFGFTLTGHDELEPHASPNFERIESMERLKNGGFKTFASIEPVIDFESSLDMIKRSVSFCDLFKVGLESGGKYKLKDLTVFIARVIANVGEAGKKVYFKDSLIKRSGLNRRDLPSFCVGRDYNLFK